MMTNKNKVDLLLEYAKQLFPNAKCELNYSKDYELVIAVMLSSQTTDSSVNKITPLLFNKYQTLVDFKTANYFDIEKIIHPLGLSLTKAKNIVQLSKILVDEYNSKVPFDKIELMKLPGIGNKSAGVIRAEVFNIADLAVDTHILRICKRLKIVESNAKSIDAERALKKCINESEWIKSHHYLIFFGRYHCLAKNPKCQNCKLFDICKTFNV